MVQCAKSVAMNIDDQAAIDSWRRRNGLVSKILSGRRKNDQGYPLCRNWIHFKSYCHLILLVSNIKACLSLRHQYEFQFILDSFLLNEVLSNCLTSSISLPGQNAKNHNI